MNVIISQNVWDNNISPALVPASIFINLKCLNHIPLIYMDIRYGTVPCASNNNHK